MQLPDHTPEKDADLAADAAFMTASLYKMLDAHADKIVADALRILAEAQDSSKVMAELLPSLTEAQTENLIATNAAAWHTKPQAAARKTAALHPPPPNYRPPTCRKTKFRQP